MHSRLTDLPPNKPGSRTSSDGTVERSVSVEQQIAGADDQWPQMPTWGGLSGTVERSHVMIDMPVLPTCSGVGRYWQFVGEVWPTAHITELCLITEGTIILLVICASSLRLMSHCTCWKMTWRHWLECKAMPSIIATLWVGQALVIFSPFVDQSTHGYVGIFWQTSH